MSQWEQRIRLILVRLAMLAAFGALVAQLWQLQIVRGQEFQQQADGQRFRIESVDAPRGVFYDRNHQLLVQNTPRFVVSVTASRLPAKEVDRRPILNRLSSLLGIPVAQQSSPPVASTAGAPSSATTDAPVDLESMVKEAEKRPFDAYPIASNIDRQVALILLEELPQMPGISVDIQPTRTYLDGPLFSQIIGYMWRMPAEQVNQYLSLPNSDYTPNDMVGYAGLERTMESQLHGQRGRKHVEVDAYGREVATLAYEPPQPGHSLVLTIDRDLQARTAEFLQQGMEAAKGKSAVAIVMAPQTGEVLAMVSLPTYDNNLFAQGNSQAYAPLLTDPTQPMFNRAIAGQYPPGSIFKIIPASGGLQDKLINKDTTFYCGGTMQVNSMGTIWNFYCWIRKLGVGHGNINVEQALAQSCDIFFYKLGGGYEDFPGLGLDEIDRYAQMFGLGSPTGIELPGEAPGLVPTSQWKRLNYEESWTTGDTYNMSIGQGFVLTTPLQMLNAYCAVANGGTLYRPQIVREIVDADGNVVQPFQPKIIRKLDVSPDDLKIVQQGLRDAVAPGGTAPLANLPEVPVAGKTGSAEFGPADAHGNRATHAWFVGYAPADKPEVAVIVFVEGGGEGSSTAAPIAANILRYYFGLPVNEAPATTP